jgi:hypothetical protein
MRRDTSTWKDSIIGLYFPLFLTAIFMFAFGFAGAMALPNYINGEAVDGQVIGFNVQRGFGCIWSGFPNLEYAVNNRTYVIDNFYPYAVCGDYQESALYNVKRAYPMGTMIRLWYLGGKLDRSGDPTVLVHMMMFCWSVSGLCLFVSLIICLVTLFCKSD